MTDEQNNRDSYVLKITVTGDKRAMFELLNGTLSELRERLGDSSENKLNEAHISGTTRIATKTTQYSARWRASLRKQEASDD